MLVFIGTVVGGQGSPRTIEAIRALQRRVRAVNPRDGSGPSLDVVHHVPGLVVQPRWSGVRTGRLSRDRDMLQVQIAVPGELDGLPEQRISEFLCRSLASAIDKAAELVATRQLDWPIAEARAVARAVCEGAANPSQVK